MPTYTPSSNVAELRESATIAVSTRAKALREAGRAVIDLGAGEPDFPTPAYVIEAAHRALDAGATRYTPVDGIAPLRELIASHATALHPGPPIAPDQVVITSGTKQALFNACFSLFSAGDEVLVPTPGWTSYYEMLALARAVPIAVRGSRAHDLKVTADDLARSASPRTRGVMLNSPCNPTGAVYTARELAAIVALAAERDWWIVSDEIYRAIRYDGPAPSLLELAESLDRIVVVDGVAKSRAMTGWRIGWSIAPRTLTRAMTALQSHTTSNASTPAQHAALAALRDAEAGRAALGAMLGAYRQRRDEALPMLRAAGFDVVEPAGAFYLYLHIAESSPADPEPGTTFARRLLEEAGVAAVPGAAFHTPEWLRISYAAPSEQVREGVRRICAMRAAPAPGPAPGDGA